MAKYINIGAQALACIILSTPILAMDVDLTLPQTPRRAAASPVAAPSTPIASPSAKIPDREWIHDGTRVITLDIEADPKLGGDITEIALVETQYGEKTGRTLHYYLRPINKVDYRFVKKVDPIDQSQQQTFAEVAKELYDFMEGAILVTYGAFDVRKLCEHFGIQRPYDRIYTFIWRDAYQMEKRDFARSKGIPIVSPPAKVTSVVSRSPSVRKKEYQRKRKASRDKKEMADLKKLIKSQGAKLAGLPSPKRKKPDSIYSGVAFDQPSVAARKGITDAGGAASVGLDATEVYKKHGIPAAHVEDHHAMPDTLKLTGILVSQGQPTLKRQIRRNKIIRALDFRGTENHDLAPNASVGSSRKRSFKSTSSTDSSQPDD